MTESSRFFDGITTGDAGPYDSAEFSEQFLAYAVGLGGMRANVGPFLGSGTQPNDGLRVQAQSPASTSVDILPGSALVNGRHYLNDDTESIVIAANASGNPRIDTVVLRADYSLQTVILAVLQGTAAASPTPPSLTQSDGVLWEIPLADIAVANGFTSIANSNITPRHEWVNAANGVYLDNILNNSGGTLVTGDVVILDTSANRAATTTTTASDKLTLGVWVGRTSNGGYGRVLKDGIGYVNCAAAVTRGQVLGAHTVAKQAAVNAAGNAGAVLATALETTSGAGLCLCYVRATVVNNLDYVVVQDQKSNGTAGQTVSGGAWRTRELQTEVTDTGSIASIASNQVTLQAGRYAAWGMMSGGATAAGCRGRLRDTTGGVTLVQGNNIVSSAGATPTIHVFGFFTLTVASAIELQQWGAGTAAAVSTGDVEVYATILFIRLGET